MPPDSEQQTLSRIESLLRHHPKGLTTSDITRHLRCNRNSTAKYLAILQTSGIVEQSAIGASKVYSLSRKVSSQNLLNCIAELILVLDNEKRVTFVNDAFLSYFATERRVLEGNTIESVPLEILRIIHERDLAGDMNAEISREIVTPLNNRIRHFRVRGLPVIFEDRKSGYTLIIEDLSDQRKAEEQLVQSEAKYRSVIEEQTDLICRRKSCGTISFANAAYHRFFRKDPGTLEGTAFYPVDLMPGLAADPDSARARILPFCNDVFEQCILLENGEVRWVQWKNTSGMDISGNLVEILSVGRDITHQREREREILIGRCSIESSEYAAVIIDIMGRIVYANRKFREIFGCESPEQILGDLLERFIPHDDPSSNICQLAQTLAKTGRWDGRVRGWCADKCTIELEMHAATIRNDRYFPMHGLMLLAPCAPGREPPAVQKTKGATGPQPHPRGVLIVDPAGKILQVNHDFLSIAGYRTKQDVLGRPASDLWCFDAGDPAGIQDRAGQATGQHRGRVFGKDGSQVPVMACLNPLHDASGSHLCSEVWIEPDRDRALAGFAENGDFFPFPTFVIDRNSNVLFWNRAMEAFTRVGRDDIVGTSEYRRAFYPYHGTQPSIIDLVGQPPEASRQIYPGIQIFGDMIMLERYIPDSRQSRGMYLLEKATPIVGPDGSTIGAIETIMDITDWKQSREQLDRMKEEIDMSLISRFRDLADRIGQTGTSGNPG